MVVDTGTGLGIDLPSGVDKVKAHLASDLFAAAGADTVINHATELIQGAAGDIGRIFRLNPSDASGALLGPGRGWSASTAAPRRSPGATWSQLTPAARRQRGEAAPHLCRRDPRRGPALLAGSSNSVPSRMHVKLGKAGAAETGDVQVGFDDVNKVWFLEVPLALKFNDEQNHDGDPESVDRRDMFAVEGRFRFEMGGDAEFARFNPGSFAIAPEVEMIVRAPQRRGAGARSPGSCRCTCPTAPCSSSPPTRTARGCGGTRTNRRRTRWGGSSSACRPPTGSAHGQGRRRPRAEAVHLRARLVRGEIQLLPFRFRSRSGIPVFLPVVIHRLVPLLVRSYTWR